MSLALQTLRRLATKPPAKAREPWREELSRWDEDARFEWEERVAIMLADAGLSLDQAERAAFLDVSLCRTATR